MQQDIPVENSPHAPIMPETLGFGLPPTIIRAMMFCYAVFFIGMFVVAGVDQRAVMMVVISALYAVMYFGVTAMLNALSGTDAEREKQQWSDGALQTIYGPLDSKSVAIQILIVPVTIAGFGVLVAIITLAVR